MPKPRQPRLVAPAPGRRCGQLPRSSPPSSRALLAGPRVVHVVPVDDLPVWWSGPQFPWQFSCGSIVKWAPSSHAASRAQWGPDFLDSPGQGRHPLPQLSGELSWTLWGGAFGVLSLTLQAPPELLSLLTAGGGENPSLAVCFAGPCASPSVSGLICRSSKFLAESCYLCTFPHLWLLLKKKVEAPFARHWGEILRAFPQRLCHLHGVSHIALDPEPPSQSQREAAALPGLSPSLSSKV